ncbi:(deoxy)nucleoside triphosphate pyrophosphohydrolase [Petrachloros mirabilis]
MKTVEVAAGLICQEGRFLIAKRKTGVHLGGFWEFPGGKREPDETFEECLRRELFEELSIRVGAPRLFQVILHKYKEETIELHFFRCSIEAGFAAPLDCDEIRWVYPHEMGNLKFPPADLPIIEALQREGNSS